jgi:uncharacterized membrane protein
LTTLRRTGEDFATTNAEGIRLIRDTVEIARSPEEVFAYLDQLERHHEWQQEIVSTSVETDGPVRVGTRVKEMRRFVGREMDSSYEITEHEPPRRTSFRGLAGPIRPVGTVTVEPAADGKHARLTLEFELKGFGIGKLFAPLAMRHAARTIARDQQRLKERLESNA